jgi:hypothetical protein
LPVEQPSDSLEDRLLAYYDRLKADLELLEKFDPGAMHQAQLAVLERAYIETPDTCDAFVTRGVISQQPQAQQQVIATLDVSSERWEAVA